MSETSRRTVLTAAAVVAACPFAPAHAAAPPVRRQAPGFHRVRIGDHEVTAVHDGVWLRPIGADFVRNADYRDVQQALTAAFQPPDRLPVPFTPLAVNIGRRLVLIDTGTGGQFASFAPQSGTWAENFAASGMDPADIDAILISHCHPDHINGLKTKDNALTFPNAEIFVAAPEWDYWMDDANLSGASDTARPQFLNARRIFRDLADRVTRFSPGRELVPGITSIAAYGHTPGHTVFAVTSGDQSLLVLGDTSNNPYLFVRNPQWQAIIDVDGPLAAATRMALLDRAAADRMLVHGYHFPFPALGTIIRTASGYDLAPAMWWPQP
ncbi:MAG TPA: MBL fold metallo-hydrolase [Xanthobacteraceae bacterium]|nr:MBL fold metallo-hydrolase [Xanthobacteraceae bacterium]